MTCEYKTANGKCTDHRRMKSYGFSLPICMEETCKRKYKMTKKYMSLYVLVDDVRDIPADIILRNGVVALQVLPNIPWDKYDRTVLILDNDLGWGPDGYQLLNYMINEWGIYPDEILLVTANPIGKQHMVNILMYDVDIYHTDDNTKFVKGDIKNEIP